MEGMEMTGIGAGASVHHVEIERNIILQIVLGPAGHIRRADVRERLGPV